MAVLQQDARAALRALIMERWSAAGLQTPITKPQLAFLIGVVDEALESAEIAIVQALPAGPEKSWLLSVPEVGRRLIELVEQKRREVL